MEDYLEFTAKPDSDVVIRHRKIIRATQSLDTPSEATLDASTKPELTLAQARWLTIGENIGSRLVALKKALGLDLSTEDR